MPVVGLQIGTIQHLLEHRLAGREKTLELLWKTTMASCWAPKSDEKKFSTGGSPIDPAVITV
eukprot:5544660-Prorocentrum_lima.AAC.1